MILILIGIGPDDSVTVRFEKDELESNISHLKEKLRKSRVNGRRFTSIRPQNQKLLFLGCPLENDECLLKDFYEISDEFFLVVKDYADDDDEDEDKVHTSYLLTEEKRLSKKKLKPLILMSNTQKKFDADALQKLHKNRFWIAYYVEKNVQGGPTELKHKYHCDKYTFDSNAKKVVVALDNLARVKREKDLIIDTPFERKYSLALKHANEVAHKNDRPYYVSSQEGYAVWFNGQNWLIGKLTEFDKIPGEEEGCIRSTTAPKNPDEVTDWLNDDNFDVNVNIKYDSDAATYQMVGDWGILQKKTLKIEPQERMFDEGTKDFVQKYGPMLGPLMTFFGRVTVAGMGGL